MILWLFYANSMQTLCKSLTSQKDAKDALGPEGSPGCRMQQGKVISRALDGGMGELEA